MPWQHFHVGPKLPGFDRKCVATLSTPINPITQENENCIYGPFEVDSTYYKYKMTSAPQMHLVFCSGHGPKLPLRAKVTRNYGITFFVESTGTNPTYIFLFRQLCYIYNMLFSLRFLADRPSDTPGLEMSVEIKEESVDVGSSSGNSDGKKECTAVGEIGLTSSGNACCKADVFVCIGEAFKSDTTQRQVVNGVRWAAISTTLLPRSFLVSSTFMPTEIKCY